MYESPVPHGISPKLPVSKIMFEALFLIARLIGRNKEERGGGKKKRNEKNHSDQEDGKYECSVDEFEDLDLVPVTL